MSLAALLGFELLAKTPGSARLRVVVAPEHLNLHGSAHGGFLFALADEAFAIASNSHGARAVALTTQMDFFRAVREGDVLEAEALEEHLGRRVASYRVLLRRDGELVARFSGTVYRSSEARAFSS